MSDFGYKKLGIWQLASELTKDIHAMTLEQLPKFEMYEEGSQIRRSIKSVKSNIVEGWGRRRHKPEYLRFLDYAYASALETVDHLETLAETGSLSAPPIFESLHQRATHLCKAAFRFIKAVETQHNKNPPSSA